MEACGAGAGMPPVPGDVSPELLQLMAAHGAIIAINEANVLTRMRGRGVEWAMARLACSRVAAWPQWQAAANAYLMRTSLLAQAAQ
jgi:hypothetical protein